MTRVLVAVIGLYRTWLSPLLGPRCRYYPSCSAFAVTALRTRGLVGGSWLTVARLCSCHPWAPGGVDFVPAQGFRSERHGPDASSHPRSRTS